MKALSRIIVFLLIALLAMPAATMAAATPAAAEAGKDDQGIPAMSVARIKINKGTAWVRPADSGEWQEYSTNTPLAERARVSVPNGSEAEILYRGSQSMVLRGGAEVEIRELGEKHATFRLQGGSVTLSLPKDEFAPILFRVPGKRAVQIDAPGRYALSADGGSTKFVVSAGAGSVTGEGAAPVAVKAGEEASIGEKIQVGRAESTATAPPGQVAEAPMTEAEQQAGIPPEAAGELRDYGKWVYTPDYGYAWSPYVAGDWTPYYYGHWVWVYPYGWVWVAYEPWGWWPYHYGWWVDDINFGWIWCPFRSFVSVNFFFGRSAFFFHRSFFFAANVRFVNDGRFIRWTPARPGTTVTRATFSRGDTRLARWNEPLKSGAVMVRGEGGRMSAWQGRHGTASGTAAAGKPALGAGNRRAAGVFPEGGGRVSARASAPSAMDRGFAGRGSNGAAGVRGTGSAGIASEPRGSGGFRGAAPRSEGTPSRSFQRSFQGGERSFRAGEGGGFRGSVGGGFRGFDGGGFRGFGGGGFRGGGMMR